MLNLDRVVVPLRVLLVLLFAGLVVAQVLSMPGEFSQLARESPEAGAWPWVLLSLVIFEILCVQVVIVCTWRLLTMVRTDRIFDRGAFVWVDVIVWTLGAAWLALAGVSAALVAFIYVTPEIRDPGIPILLFGMVLFGGVIFLTVVVLRALLRQAAALRADMAEVI